MTEKKKKEKIAKIKEERDKYLAGWQRCRADFLNYKKQEIERLKDLIDFEKEGWALELLNIIEHFEKAKEQIGKEKNSIIEGFLQIQKYFESFLKSQGVKKIEREEGDIFSPETDEVMEIEERQDKKEGEILKIIQQGYDYKNKIIRPTRVRVAKKRSEKTNS
jgi:molecular chaperone GrpE